MQIILIICKDVALSVFPGLPDRSIQETISWLQSIQISGDYYMTFGAVSYTHLDVYKRQL